MSLFIVRHQHDAARCPAQDPYLGAALLDYLSRPRKSQFASSSWLRRKEPWETTELADFR
jgi:hypothetical protein